MDTLKFSLLLAISLFLSACGAKKNASDSTKNQVEFTENNEENPIQILSPCLAVDTNPRMEYETVNALITDYKQEANCIILSYQYSGCKSGRPHLIATNIINAKKSLLIKLQLLIENAGECDMLLTEKKHFSLQNVAADQDLSLDFNDGELMVEFKKPEAKINTD